MSAPRTTEQRSASDLQVGDTLVARSSDGTPTGALVTYVENTDRTTRIIFLIETDGEVKDVGGSLNQDYPVEVYS